MSPPVATALGICMRAAAVGVAPHGAGASPWMRAVDPERWVGGLIGDWMDECMREWLLLSIAWDGVKWGWGV